MSGPKVISTVTVDELREVARVQLALVESALERWQRETTGRDAAATSRWSRLLEERDRISDALARDQFRDVAIRSEAVVAGVDHDVQQRQRERDDRNARARAKEKSLRYTARSVLDRCHQATRALAEGDRRILESAARGEAIDLQRVASVADECLRQIVEAGRNHQARNRQALAQSLSGGGDLASAEQLLNALRGELEDPRLLSVERGISELDRLGEQQLSNEFDQRLASLVEDHAGDRSTVNGLALDVLGTELSRSLTTARKKAELRRELAAEIASATATNDRPACQQAIQDAELALEANQLDQVTSHIESIRQQREARRRSRAALTARNAILSGLKQLGYAVQDGMQATWVERKRIIVRHPEQRGVALELTGDGDTGRLQTRMVSIQGEDRGTETDKAVEETWCEELKRLQTAVAQCGGTIHVEKALPAGAYPLKLIVDEQVEMGSDGGVAKPRLKQLP